MSDTTLAWETDIYQDAKEPIFRTVYGRTLLEAVQDRWSSEIHQDPQRFFVPGLLGSSHTVTVVSGTGAIELVVCNEVNEVRVDDISSLAFDIHLD